MSGSPHSPEVLKPYVLRSSTPAPSEKVLLYLEGMEKAGILGGSRKSVASSNIDARSASDRLPPDPAAYNPMDPVMTKLPSDNGIYAPSPRRSPAPAAVDMVDDPRGSEMSWEHIGGKQEHVGGKQDDAESNVQDGRRSPDVESVNIHTTGFKEFPEQHGDGPHLSYGSGPGQQADDPQPHYVSYGSGPSFGNIRHIPEGFYPQPGPEDEPGPHYVSYGSSFGNLGPLPDEVLGGGSVQPWFQRTPNVAAGIPLPAETVFSPKSASYRIDVESPTPPGSRAHANASRAGSRLSNRSEATERDMPQTNGTTPHVPRPFSRPPSEKPVSVKTSSDVDHDRPFSPRSVASRAPSARSKAPSARPPPSVAGTHYPALPASRAGTSPGTSAGTTTDDTQSSPRMPNQPAAPSVAPSNARSVRSAFNPAPASATSQPYYPSALEADTVRPPSAYAGSRHSRAGSTHSFQPFPPATPQYPAMPLHQATPLQPATPLHPLTPLLAMRQAAAGPPSAAGSFVPPSSHRAPSPQYHRTSVVVTPQSVARSRALSPTHSHMRHPPPQSYNSRFSTADKHDPHATPTPSRPHSPDMDEYEAGIVQDLLSRTPRTRTSYATTSLEAEVKESHFHDQDLCILLHAADDQMTHDVVKKAVRKAVKARIKKLGMKYDTESIKAYRKNYHNHDPSWHQLNPPQVTSGDEPPAWARGMMDQLAVMEQRVAALGPKIESLKTPDGSHNGRTQSHRASRRAQTPSQIPEETYSATTPRTQSQNVLNQMTGTMGDESMYRPPDTEFTARAESTRGQTLPGSIHHNDGSTHGPADQDEFEDDNETHAPNGHTYTSRTPPMQDGDTRARYGRARDHLAAERGDSPGQQYLEEELYKLRVREPSHSAVSHRSWEIAREDPDGDAEDAGRQPTVTDSADMPEIAPDSAAGVYEDRRKSSPPLPPLPADTQSQSRGITGAETPAPHHQPWAQDGWAQDPPPPPPWQRIHQRLLGWAIVWPVSELDTALNSTLRGSQVDEVALSIWSTQQYKRYVRQQLTEVPPGRVDRLFVPPNMADAINNAVFHGRHGDACGMLRDLWAPFGLEGMPRIIIVLCKHRSDPNHWVAHKFSLPDGTLTTYDTYPEKCLPDGRPLGWWFAIRIAWPTAMYPSPDHLMQKMVRLHRPMQLAIDNAVAAAGIWRNLLMSSRAERPLDLERLRDLINTEVKNLRQRKEQGKLSIAAPRPNWEMGG